MSNLIKSSIVTYTVNADEHDIRAALVREALEKHGLLHEGKMIPGITTKVTYDGRRGSGTYTVHITRDVSKSGQAQLSPPEKQP